MTWESLTQSSGWQLAAWTIIHTTWIAGLVGILALFLRAALARASSQIRYTIAVSCLTVIAAAPVVIASFLVTTTTRSNMHPFAQHNPTRGSQTSGDLAAVPTESQAVPMLERNSIGRDLQSLNWPSVIQFVPAVWLSIFPFMLERDSQL